MSEAIDRELAAFQQHAGAPRPVGLGCTTISHERMGFCSACVPGRLTHLELICWRLLALREASD